MTGKKTWRLSKTLKRSIEVRPIEQEDVKYAWAAYKKGGLGGMGFAPDLNPQKFKDAFEAYVLSNAHAAWTVIAGKPIGFVLGSWAPQQAYMVIVGIVWFPWATKRNIVEGAVSFFKRLNTEMGWMGFASAEHKKLYEVCMMHGIMRRVGTSHMSGAPVSIFEARIQ